jgi:hypothetical protein
MIENDKPLPKMTQAMGNKVVASSDVSGDTPVNRPAPPPEAGITSMTPIAAQRRAPSDTASPTWPAPQTGPITYYGRGPK